MAHGRRLRSGKRGLRLLPFAAWLGVAAVVGLTGCEGDDGERGAEGPQGPGGQPGPTGPTGPTGPVPGTPGVPISSSQVSGIVPQITRVTVPADTGKPVIEFTVRDEINRPLTGLTVANVGFAWARLTTDEAGNTLWQSLTQQTEQAGTGSWPGTGSATQGTTEPASAGTLAESTTAAGSYTYTSSVDLRNVAGVTYDANLAHRVGVEIRNYPAANSLHQTNSPYTFKPGTGEAIAQSGREIVDDDTCETCHDILEFHGGVRTDTQYCVVCHNPSSTDAQSGNTVDMTVMIHKIHAGASLPSVQAGGKYQIWGFRNEEHDYSEVVFPANVLECRTCHEEDDAATPQASNWRTQPSIRGCGSCHDDVNFQTGENHQGIRATDAQCDTCHGPNTTFNLRAEDVHFVAERVAAGQFRYDIVEVTNSGPGQAPVVRFRVTNPQSNDSAWNIQTGAPFTQCTGGASRLAITVAWPTVPDYTNVGSGVPPAQPITLNPLTACGGTSTANPDGTFTVTSTTPIPADATGTATVALEGHPAVNVSGDANVERIAVPNVHRFAAITDPSPVERRKVVDIERCDQCHGVVTAHGNNRTEDLVVCATCHNPNATDIARRVAASECVTQLGTDDAPIDFKWMIHAIHAGKAKICGFGNTAHSYTELAYPGRIDNCEGCHLEDTYYPVDGTTVLPTTIDAGVNTTDLSDDRAVTPNTSACSACHDSAAAIAHMEDNGGSFNARKNANGTLASPTIETCLICHGPGREADVKDAHQVTLFPGNQQQAATQ